jgi:hypothetical protein
MSAEGGDARQIEIEIFKAGKHIAMDGSALSFGAADLAATAAAYEPAKHEASLVIGHPTTDGPAWGWVKGLRVEGDALIADVHQIDPGFAEAVNAGRYKKVSACFWRPDAETNPTPGVYALRHVGFLGAAPPAVKGLRPVQFAMARALAALHSERALAALNGDDADFITFAEKEASPLSETVDFAAREAALAAREASLAAQETALRRAGHLNTVNTLVGEGRVLPAHREALVSFMAALDAHTGTVAFGEGAPVTPAAWFKTWLATLPAQVPLGETAARTGAEPAIAFAAPPGVPVDQARLALHGKALAYQETHPGIDYVTAVQRVGG